MDAPRSRRLRAVLLAVFAAAVLGSLPASASAGTASIVAGDRVDYTAPAGQVNNVTISLSGPAYTVTDTSAPVVAGAGCAPLGANTASCPAAGIDSVDVSVNDLSDAVTLNAVPRSFVQGGDGNDALTGGIGYDNLRGEAGADALRGGAASDSLDGGPDADLLEGGDGIDLLDGGPGTDTLDGGANADDLSGGGDGDALNGGAGDDLLHGGPGADTLAGGPGRGDTASYRERIAPVTADTDGVANDGEAGEGDNVAPDVEGLEGGVAGDVLTGSAAADQLLGSDGNDVLDGAGGSDVVDGGAGADTLRGGAGDDQLDTGAAVPFGIPLEGIPTSSSEGNDTLGGGTGDDLLDGGADTDVIRGGAGDDLVSYARRVPVRVDLDGKADDGETGEGDRVGTDVEAIEGGAAADRLTGNARANDLFGNGGADTLRGGAGSDELSGGIGADVLDGGTGRDSFWGGPGRDQITSRDRSADQVGSCGSDSDSVRADRRDAIARDCERVSFR